MTDPPPASRSLRVLYLATLVAIVFPRALLGTGWVGLATGGGIAMLGLWLLPVIGLVAWRFTYVFRNPQALASPPDHPVAALIRGVGLLLMAVSTLASIAQLFIGPITRLLLGRADGGEAGVGYFVVGLGLYLASGLALLGILIFELGRWIARRAETLDPQIQRRIAAATLGCIVLLLVAHLAGRAYVQSGHRALLTHCGAMAEPVVKRQLSEVPPGILVTENGPPELPWLSWRSDILAGASGLAFVESCNGTQCTKWTARTAGSRSSLKRENLSSPTSRIEMALSSATLEEAFLSARLLRLRYEIRTTDTHEVLAETSEWVYDWGDWNRPGLTSHTTRKDACGYAQPDVHPFRQNATSGAIANAYAAADVRFLLSVVPRAMQPANAAMTVEMLSPSIPAQQWVDTNRPPPAGPLETVVSESSRERRTMPTLPDGSRAAALTLPSTKEAPRQAESGAPALPSLLSEDFRGTVRLRANNGGRLSEDGLTFQHCCAGALSSAAATRHAPAGRSYMEAMFIAEQGRQSSGTFTRLGVGAASGARDFSAELLRHAAQTSTLKSGDIVGVLIDTDVRRVEYYAKGQLVSVHDLYDLRTTELALWVAASAGHGGANSSDRWIVNFGAAPFVYPPGGPILTYEGRIQRP